MVFSDFCSQNSALRAFLELKQFYLAEAVAILAYASRERKSIVLSSA
jgi:hypothetical protein